MDSLDLNPRIFFGVVFVVFLTGICGGSIPIFMVHCPQKHRIGLASFSNGSVLALLFGQVLPRLFTEIRRFHASIPVDFLCGAVVVLGKLNLLWTEVLLNRLYWKVTVKQGFPEPSNGDLWTAMENASDSNDDESDELQHFLHSVNNEAPTKRRQPHLLWIISVVAPLSIHALMEGFALGTQHSWANFVAFGISLALHKWVVTLSLGSLMMQAKIQGPCHLLTLAIFVTMTPTGAILARSTLNIFDDSALSFKLMQSYSTGILLHLATVEHNGTCNFGIGSTTLCYTLGVISMFVLQFFLHSVLL